MIQVRYTYGTAKKKPAAGDEKFVKGTGKTMIRQQQMSRGIPMVSGSRPVWEWVEKGGDRDRTVTTGGNKCLI
jgi:hypothetical protein